MITVIDEQTDLPLDTSSIPSLVKWILTSENHEEGELTLYFVTQEKICELHDAFFNDPSPTDCISFPMDNDGIGPPILGDIFVCPKVAMEYVQNHSVNHDAYAETTLYVIHGLLHLLGYRDEEDSLREIMHTKQNQYLNTICKKKLVLKSPV